MQELSEAGRRVVASRQDKEIASICIKAKKRDFFALFGTENARTLTFSADMVR